MHEPVPESEEPIRDDVTADPLARRYIDGVFPAHRAQDNLLI